MRAQTLQHLNPLASSFSPLKSLSASVLLPQTSSPCQIDLPCQSPLSNSMLEASSPVQASDPSSIFPSASSSVLSPPQPFSLPFPLPLANPSRRVTIVSSSRPAPCTSQTISSVPGAPAEVSLPRVFVSPRILHDTHGKTSPFCSSQQLTSPQQLSSASVGELGATTPSLLEAPPSAAPLDLWPHPLRELQAMPPQLTIPSEHARRSPHRSRHASPDSPVAARSPLATL